MCIDYYEKIRTVEYKIIYPLVNEVRRDLRIRYNISEGINKDYRGLCDEASMNLKAKLTDDKTSSEILKIIPGGYTVTLHHGELAHTPAIASRFWSIRHTWVEILFTVNQKSREDKYMTVYVDCTSQQFRDMFDDIPESYISISNPPWYYDDLDNPAYNGFTHKINEAIKAPMYGGTHREGIIEFCQYEIWGMISDIIRSHRLK